MSSLIDEDEMICPVCGHAGLLPAGGFDLDCPACGATVSLDDEED